VLSHGTDDPDVSVQYTCALAQELLSAGFPVTLNLRPGEGHFCDSDFVERSWRYLSRARSHRWLARGLD
jgi:predicted esterase